VFIQLEGQSWHVLALQGDKDNDEKLSRTMSVQHNGQKVELQLPNGYDYTSCHQTPI
jgi:hypothetical protein